MFKHDQPQRQVKNRFTDGHYDQLDEAPKRHILRGIVLVIVLSLLVAVGYTLYLATNVAKISTNPLNISGLMADDKGRTNVLVLGIGDPGHSGEKLSDSMMVLSLDSRTKRVAQISIPRDLRVDIPGTSGANKINAANAIGGPSLAAQTVSNTLGVPIHYYLETNFTGLKQMVDAVGGIDVDVKSRLYDPEYPCDTNESLSCGVDISPGPQHMDGAIALKYVRCRKGTCGNDFGRAARQQEVITLVKAKLLRADVLLNPAKLNPIVSAFRSGITTDMGAVQLAQFAWAWQSEAKNTKPISFVLSTSDGGLLKDAYGSSDLVPVDGIFSAVQQKVQNIFTEP